MFKLKKTPANSEIILKFDLDLNGILKIKAIEKKTGREINAVIEDTMSGFDEGELAEVRSKIDSLWDKDRGDESKETTTMPQDMANLINKAREKLKVAPGDDKDEIINLIEDIQRAIKNNNLKEAENYQKELDDLLFYMG